MLQGPSTYPELGFLTQPSPVTFYVNAWDRTLILTLRKHAFYQLNNLISLPFSIFSFIEYRFFSFHNIYADVFPFLCATQLLFFFFTIPSFLSLLRNQICGRASWLKRYPPTLHLPHCPGHTVCGHSHHYDDQICDAEVEKIEKLVDVLLKKIRTGDDGDDGLERGWR